MQISGSPEDLHVLLVETAMTTNLMQQKCIRVAVFFFHAFEILYSQLSFSEFPTVYIMYMNCNNCIILLNNSCS